MLGRSLLMKASGAAKEFNYLDPANIGMPTAGGYFAGLISHTADGNPTHALIVAPRATGATGTGYTLTAMMAWKTTDTSTTGATSPFDGVANTNAMIAAGIANHPAAEFCANLTIGGFDDWYLPARFELEIAYYNLKPTTTANNTAVGINNYSVPKRTVNYTTAIPAQTSVSAFTTSSEAFIADWHWSSGEFAATTAAEFPFSTGAVFNRSKTTQRRVRAFRRVSL
jgi:hypothetical protein